MFQRQAIEHLSTWAARKDRKPLILRGARQVGKTTIVKLFAKQFDQFLYLNLEKPDDQNIFKRFDKTEELLEAIFFLKNQVQSSGKILIFIDEIQEVPSAIARLRYFYEEFPHLYIIAAGSLLETLFERDIKFPVGRVEYLVLRPVSFPEFLRAMGEESALQQLNKVPLSAFAHDKLLNLFHKYALIGGMPEIVQHFALHGDIKALQPIYESLIISYQDDVEKYARNDSVAQVLRHVIRNSYLEAGKRIKFQGFGRSNYGSREVGESLRTLEKALLLNLVYPTSGTKLPILPELKKSPKLQVLDTGMMNHFLGIQQLIFGTKDLNENYQGIVAEHLIGQEILASKFTNLHQLSFWVRQKKDSSAEVDFVYAHQGLLIPIEVKAGATGRLRSLHLFMDMAPHSLAVRMYAGELSVEKLSTLKGKEYFLLNLPYFLASKLDEYLTWFNTQLE